MVECGLGLYAICGILEETNRRIMFGGRRAEVSSTADKEANWR